MTSDRSTPSLSGNAGTSGDSGIPAPRRLSCLSLRRALATGVAALLLTVVFSWPLARYATRGIVYTAFEQHPGEPLSMVPGDHLQFLYHLWLAQDTFEGRTPLFHNLYEFNTGDDAERRDVTPYYLPFSAFFAAASIPFGQAAG